MNSQGKYREFIGKPKEIHRWKSLSMQIVGFQVQEDISFRAKPMATKPPEFMVRVTFVKVSHAVP
jgi:hypothetical protein